MQKLSRMRKDKVRCFIVMVSVVSVLHNFCSFFLMVLLVVVPSPMPLWFHDFHDLTSPATAAEKDYKRKNGDNKK